MRGARPAGAVVWLGVLVTIVEFEATGAAVAEVLSSIDVGNDPGILIGGQVGQGLYSVSVEPCPGIVTGGQVGQGL